MSNRDDGKFAKFGSKALKSQKFEVRVGNANVEETQLMMKPFFLGPVRQSELMNAIFAISRKFCADSDNISCHLVSYVAHPLSQPLSNITN